MAPPTRTNPMRRRRLGVVALAGVLVVSGLAACGKNSGTSGSTKSNANGVLNVGMPNGPQPNNNNPFVNTSASSSLGYKFVLFEPLVMTNQIKPADPGKPWLATKWEWSGNFTKLALTARPNVKFSDGQPMTADDFAYTFQLLRDNPGLNINSFPVVDATASGDVATITFKTPQFVNQARILSILVVPKHQWSTFADPTKETLPNPIGTGPYTLKSFTPQTMTVHVRDSGYWQALPKVAEIRYTAYSDNSTETAALSNGSAEWGFTFIPNPKAVYTSKDPAHLKYWAPATLSIHGLWLNTTKKPFDNPILRRAMNMVINRDDILNQGESGYWQPKVDNITGIPTPAGDPFIAPEYKGKLVTVDVPGAKKLLTDNGFTYSGTTLKDPTGASVSITLSNPAGWSDYITDLEIIKDNLSQIGITATVDRANQDAWTKNMDIGNFQAAMHWTNGGATPYDLYQSMLDGALYKPIGTGGINGNYGRFQNADATNALLQYASAADETARTAALNTLQKIMVEQMPVLVTGASNAGGEYSTKNWLGWPDDTNPYGPLQPTQINALDIVLHLTPAS